MITVPLHKVLVAPDALDKIKPTLHSGLLTEGPRVKEFEAKLSDYIGAPILAMNSCTSAIELALHLCDVGPGDEIVGTPLTCAATYVGAIRRGARIVWSDVDPETGLIDPQYAVKCITPRTKAVMVVDWAGRPVDCDAIRALETGNFRGNTPTTPIIQDAAHSFGAEKACMPAHGSIYRGDYTCFSFQAIKHLTTGDGGALGVSHSLTHRDRARALRWFGIDRETKAKFRFLQDIPEAGYKFHMSDWTAALGLANFDAAVAAVNKHRQNADELSNALAGLKVVQRPPRDPGSSWWFYSLRTPKPLEFVEFAEARGIGAGPVHGRCDHYTCMDRGHHPLPGVDAYYSQHVAIPCGWWLSQSDLEQIAETVITWDKTL
jgi:dTDP-4-amino-4,6-dideoxygalactose transaminase